MERDEKKSSDPRSECHSSSRASGIESFSNRHEALQESFAALRIEMVLGRDEPTPEMTNDAAR
jgi:hypothetical protein